MSLETKKIVEDLNNTFAQYKDQNDARLTKIEEGRGTANDDEILAKMDDAMTEMTGLKKQLNDIEAAANRPDLGGDAAADKAKAEHKTGFNAFMRTGTDDGLRDLELQAKLTTQSDPDGGYITPEEVDSMVTRAEADIVAMRNLALVVPVGSAEYKKIHNVGGASSGWVGEEEARLETNTPVLKALNFPTREVYAEPHATQGMLDDGQFDVESWLASEIAIEFAEQEGAAFITGDGIAKPRGILDYPTIANASYSWGNLGFIVSGNATALNSANALIDLVHGLKRGYRNGGAFLMNDLTLGSIRKLKDVAGNYIFQPGLTADTPETILNKPVEIDDNMPDIAANALAVAFGNFSRGYVITDRMGIRVLRDPYTSKPYVKFYTTKRVGGGVANFEAIKLMKIAA